jgi:hypothetical protein
MACLRKAYFTFRALKLLLETPDRVRTVGSDDGGFLVMAGLSKDKQSATVLISNFGHPHRHYNLSFRGLPSNQAIVYEKYMIDSSHDLELTKSESFRLNSGAVTLTEDVEAPSVCLIRLRSGLSSDASAGSTK